jgi:guanylate kinase
MRQPGDRIGHGAIIIIVEPFMDHATQPGVMTPEFTAESWYNALQMPRPLLVIISGPSGVGKDVTIRMMKEHSFPVHFVVTATTRPQRPGEVDGVDYHFISVQAFEQMIADDQLLEYALVYGQYKGIPKAGIKAALDSGQDVIMRIDVQGAATVRRLVPQAVTIFLSAESEEALVERLRRRRTEDESQLQRRIETARAELGRANEFKYRVVNRECALDATVEAVIAIMKAEKCRIDWQPVVL